MKLATKQALMAMEGLDNLCRQVYEKSCKGDWSCIEDIKFLSGINTFWLHHCLLETCAHNLWVGIQPDMSENEFVEKYMCASKEVQKAVEELLNG